MTNDRILVVSDLHAPFGHKDTVPFLAALKKKYRPTRVVFTGDEADKQAIKFHDKDPDLPACGDELDQAIEALKPLYQLFPTADVLDSNHGSLAYRRAIASGLSRKYLKSYGEALQAPKGWRWHNSLLVTIGAYRVFFHHGLHSNVAQAVRRRGVCIVQGHHHTRFEIAYVANPHNVLWGMTVGCLIDNESRAFAYNKLFLDDPMLGCGGIIDGQPRLFPMLLNSEGRWNGQVP